MVKARWRIIEEMSVAERLQFFETTTYEGRDGKSRLIILHTGEYIKARDSFYTSREWKDFRDFFLHLFPDCEECKKPADSVHHKGYYTIDLTLIEEGFLRPLKDFTRFGSSCRDCHYFGHIDLIAAEFRRKNDV